MSWLNTIRNIIMGLIRFGLWILSYFLLWLLIATLWLWILTTLYKEPKVKEQLLTKIEIFYQPLRRLGWEEVSLRFLWRRVIVNKIKRMTIWKNSS